VMHGNGTDGNHLSRSTASRIKLVGLNQTAEPNLPLGVGIVKGKGGRDWSRKLGKNAGLGRDKVKAPGRKRGHPSVLDGAYPSPGRSGPGSRRSVFAGR
jgi:hypothetical protein